MSGLYTNPLTEMEWEVEYKRGKFKGIKDFENIIMLYLKFFKVCFLDHFKY